MADTVGRARRSETFECRWYERWTILAGVVLFLPMMGAIVVGLVLAGSTDMPGTLVVIPALFLAVFGYELLWVPSRVTLDDGGVLLRSPCRRVSITWEDLVDVERLGGKSRKVKWRRTKGLAVSATDEFVDLRRLLTAIERRAPHVAVYG